MRIYLFGKGKLRFLSKTIEMVRLENGKKLFYRIPFKNTKEIFLFGSFGLTYKSINRILDSGCTIHFFSLHGKYKGSLVPDGLNMFTDVFNSQYLAYINHETRLRIAKWFVAQMKETTMRIFKKLKPEYYEKVSSIEIDADTIEGLMGLESSIWKYIYDFLRESSSFFDGRNYHPPRDPSNATISFSYSIIYAMITKKLWTSGLNPYIGFLHKPKKGRYSLSLDFSELIKPIFVTTLFPKLINKIFSESMYTLDRDCVYLNDLGKRYVISIIEKFFGSRIKIWKKPITVERYLVQKIGRFKESILEVGRNVCDCSL